MGYVKGQIQKRKWRSGKRLTRKEAMLAHCYICNGEESGSEDCLGEAACPLYPYFSYKGK